MAYLERSGAHPIRVFFILQGRYTEGYASFLQDVLPHAGRWEEFYFRAGLWLPGCAIILQRLERLCFALQLPQLQSMTLVLPGYRLYENGETALDGFWGSEDNDSRGHFYKTWKTPSLKKLRTRNVMPLCTGGILNECEIKLSSRDQWALTSLADLSSVWKQLKKLSFTVGDGLSNDTITELKLPYLQELCLQLYISDPQNSVLLSALYLPRLESMDVTFSKGSKILVRGTQAKFRREFGSQYEPILEADRQGGFTDLADVIFGQEKEYPYLHTLAIRGIFGGERADESQFNSAIDIIYSKLRLLQHFTIECCDFIPPKTFSYPIPPLRTLKLADTVFLDVAFLKLVSDGLRTSSEWDRFERLDIQGASKLNKEMLLQADILPETMVNLNIDGDSEDDPWTDSESECPRRRDSPPYSTYRSHD